MSDNSDQLRFDENGELQETDEDAGDAQDNLKDNADPMGRFESKAGFNIFALSSCLQKAVRRSDESIAAWCAWELTRSGFEKMYWKRVLTIATEDVAVDDSVISQVRELYQLGTGRIDAVDHWSGTESRGRISAMRAAIACAKATSSRRTDFMNETFDLIAEERIIAARDGRDPLYDFPAGDLDPDGLYDVIYDMHTAGGSGRGRGYGHFLVHSSRTDHLSEAEVEFKRMNMELVEASDEHNYTFNDEEYAHALSAVASESPWEEPDLAQETLSSE